MAIDPPSDILLDVARAADPMRAASVVQRLNALAGNAPANEIEFAKALDRAGSSAAGRATALARAPDQTPAAGDPVDAAKTKFEAVLLTNMIGEMLPKDATDVYGGGFGGDMWRSMLAEQIGNQIAKSGALGISRRLFDGGHAGAASALMRAKPTTAADHRDEILMSANGLSLPPSADVEGGSYVLARGEAR
ncbi:MAG: rod-binding protein [Roseiarcus sp.]